MAEAIVHAVVEYGALALVIWFSVQVIKMILDKLGAKIDRLADAVEALVKRQQP